MTPKWEYRSERNMTQGDMNVLGELGWELVTVTLDGVMYFKRGIYPPWE